MLARGLLDKKYWWMVGGQCGSRGAGRARTDADGIMS
jgi:hypothetical protein